MADTPDPTGTTLQGYLFAYYRALVAAFGEPKPTADGKTDARWVINTPYGVATISNRTDLPAAEAISWAIGARTLRPGIWVNNQLPDPYGPEGPYWPKEDKLRDALSALTETFGKAAVPVTPTSEYSCGVAEGFAEARRLLLAALEAVS
jgi:hypothetical protein